MENSEITWTGSPDDMTARSGEYVLRLENMGFSWEWKLYLENTQLAKGETWFKKKAKAAAINAMNEHLKTCKD